MPNGRRLERSAQGSRSAAPRAELLRYVDAWAHSGKQGLPLFAAQTVLWADANGETYGDSPALPGEQSTGPGKHAEAARP